MKPYKTIKRSTLIKGKILDVVCDTITLPNGNTADREVVLHGDASAILPIDSDGNLMFVRQYRHPAGALVLEIPAGMIDDGETPLQCAVRELEEETSYRSDNVTFMFSMYSSIGFCDEILYIYLANDLQNGVLNLDEEEFISIERYSLDDSIKMIFDNVIVDSKTISAILAYKQLL